MENDTLWRPLYPFTSHFLPLGATRMHYLDEGCGDVLLMVHGNPTWSFYWRHLITALRSEYRCIAVDHIGCGLSDKPQDYSYCLDQHIDNLVALIDHLDIHNATLICHDWGGPIGLGARAARPERFARIVLFNTGAFPPPFVPWRIRACKIPVIGTWLIRKWNVFARAALHMAVANRERMTPAVRAGLLAPYDSWENRIAIDRFVRDIPRSPRQPTWQTLARIERSLAELGNVPCQLIWGMRDWCFRPECLERFCQLIPAAEVHRLADASHYVIEDAYEQIIPRLTHFLQRNSGS